MADPDCLHLVLNRSLVGLKVFWKCAACKKNFEIQPLVITVSYPDSQK